MRLPARPQLLAALAALACLADASSPADRLAKPAEEARARAIFREVRCVVCQNESIDDSQADLAHDLRQAVRGQIAAGASDAQVRGFLVHRYGEFILLKPAFSWGNALLWLTPFAIVLAGGSLLLRRRAPTAEAEVEPLSADEEQRLRNLNTP